MEIKELNFKQNLRRLRKEKGLSQKKLAELSGLTLRMINYYENEALNPPIDNIEAIAKALGVSINELLGKNETIQSQSELELLDTRTINKLKTILSLSKENRHIIYMIADALLLKQNQESQ